MSMDCTDWVLRHLDSLAELFADYRSDVNDYQTEFTAFCQVMYMESKDA